MIILAKKQQWPIFFCHPAFWYIIKYLRVLNPHSLSHTHIYTHRYDNWCKVTICSVTFSSHYVFIAFEGIINDSVGKYELKVYYDNI